MDIRNFFGAKGPGKGAPKSDPASSVKGSGSVEKKKKRANVISDSDSDEEIEKKPKVEAKKVTPKKEDVKDKTKSASTPFIYTQFAHFDVSDLNCKLLFSCLK